MFRDCDKTHYYRFNDFNGPTPEQEAIEELQEDVERIDGEIGDIKSDIDRIDDDVIELKKWQDEFQVHTHQSNVARFYCATYGNDNNDGTRAHPFRTLIPIFDPKYSKINFQDTAIRIDFLDAGGYQAFEEYQEWPWFNGCFIRFVGPPRTSLPDTTAEMPTIHFNCHAISFSNSYIGTDYVNIRVNDGTYDTQYGEAYNRMHLNNTSLICKCTYFNESRTAPHCGNATFYDCWFNKFACTNANVEFSRLFSDNQYAFTALKWDSPQTPLSCASSIVRFDGKIRLQQPHNSTISNAAVYNHGSVMMFGGDITYYGDGTGKYNYGISTTYGINLMGDARWNQLDAMGVNGNTTNQNINLRVKGNIVIG